MKYIVSQWGNGLSVGLIGTPDEVERDKNLAHNLFGAKSYDDLFNGRINFKSISIFTNSYSINMPSHAWINTNAPSVWLPKQLRRELNNIA
jgi:hypothetical protein